MQYKTRYKYFEISSSQNQRYKNWLKLLESKGVKKQKSAIISGMTFLEEILTQFPERVLCILVKDLSTLDAYPVPNSMSVYLLAPALYAALDIYGTKGPLLVIEAPEVPLWNGRLKSGVTLFLPFQNPINLGTTIRTAAAFDADVVLLQEAASPYLPKSLRAAGPAIFQTSLFQGPESKKLAQIEGLALFALSPLGEDIFSFSFPETLGLVAGAEGPGLDDFWPKERRLTIPMQNGVESFNAAISVAIALACKQFSTK